MRIKNLQEACQVRGPARSEPSVPGGISQAHSLHKRVPFPPSNPALLQGATRTPHTHHGCGAASWPTCSSARANSGESGTRAGSTELPLSGDHVFLKEEGVRPAGCLYSRARVCIRVPHASPRCPGRGIVWRALTRLREPGMGLPWRGRQGVAARAPCRPGGVWAPGSAVPAARSSRAPGGGDGEITTWPKTPQTPPLGAPTAGLSACDFYPAKSTARRNRIIRALWSGSFSEHNSRGFQGKWLIMLFFKISSYFS